MKERLDAFSDAIMAIIITIMVLELPELLNNTPEEYLALAKSVAIYLISFCFVATMWYQHATIFNAVKQIDNKALVMDLAFLAVLSLTPLATKIISLDITNGNAMGYGVLIIIVQVTFLLLQRMVVDCQPEAEQALLELSGRMHRLRPVMAIFVNLFLIVLAYFSPHLAVFLYLTSSILSFFNTARSREELDSIQKLDFQRRRALLSMNEAELVSAGRELRQSANRRKQADDRSRAERRRQRKEEHQKRKETRPIKKDEKKEKKNSGKGQIQRSPKREPKTPEEKGE